MKSLRLAGIFAVYILLAKLGLLLATVNASASPVWPATGFAIAAVYVFGNGVWPAISLGALLSNALVGGPWYLWALIAAGNTLEAWAGAAILRRMRSYDSLFSVQTHTLGYVSSACLAPLLSASFGVLGLLCSGRIPPVFTNLQSVWFTWWLGDAVGTIVLAPFLIEIGLGKRKGVAQALAAGAAAFLVSAYIFQTQTNPSFTLILFPFLLATVAFAGKLGARWSLIVIAVVAVGSTLAGKGVFMSAHLNSNLINLQVFMATVALTALMLEGFKRSVPLRFPGALLILGWALSAVLLNSIHKEELAKDQRKMEELVADTTKAIERRLADYIDALSAGRALFAASESVTEHEWAQFVEATEVQSKYPGIRGMGVVWPVKDPEVKSFERRQSKRLTSFHVHSVKENGPSGIDHYVITYVSPAQGNEFAIGLDVGSEANRRAAAELARDSGLPTITNKISLVQQSGSPGFLLFVPMYWQKTTWPSVEERRQHFRGWIYAAFVTRDFLEGVLGRNERELSFAAFDGPPSLENQIYPQGAFAWSEPGLMHSTSILGQRPLTFVWKKVPGLYFRFGSPVGLGRLYWRALKPACGHDHRRLAVDSSAGAGIGGAKNARTASAERKIK